MDDYQITDYVTGCCMLLSWELINKLNGFNEKYKMYCEDVDLCIRAKKYGSNCYVVKKSKIWHKVSRSIGGNWSMLKNIRKMNSIFKLINTHSMIIFKITGFFGFVLVTLISLPSIIIKYCKFRLNE